MSQNRFVAFLEEFWSSVTEEKSSPKPSGNNTDQKTVLSILSKLLPCALSYFSLFYTHIRNSPYFQSLKKKIYGWFVFFLCCLWVGKPPAVCGVWIRPNGRCWMGFIFPSNYLIAASYYSFMFQQQHKNWRHLVTWGIHSQKPGLCASSSCDSCSPKQTRDTL